MVDLNEGRKVAKGIEGLKLVRIYRDESRVFMDFGKKYNDNEKNIKYTLGVISIWRLKTNKVVLGARDIFVPASSKDKENFHWKVIGDTKFDEKVSDINKNLDDIGKVSLFDIDDSGDILITFENGYIFETCVVTSVKDVEWWIEKHSTEKFYVYYE